MTRLRPSPPRLSPSLPLVLVALWACAGGQTGDGDPIDQREGGDGISADPGTEAAPHPQVGEVDRPTGNLGEEPDTPAQPCSYRSQAISDWEQELPLGFSARDILRLTAVPSTVSTSFRSTAELSIGPEVGPSEITLVFSPVGESFFLTMSEAPECPPSVDIDGLLSIQSRGGAIDEVIPLTLHARDTTHATFEYTVPANRLRGSLQVLATKPEGGALQSVRVQGQWGPQGSCGSLTAVLAFAAPSPSNSPRFGADPLAEGLVAQWPDGSSCQPALP